ncbi:MAG: FAD-dependent oxidoreductase [Pseudomonadota bacterium]
MQVTIIGAGVAGLTTALELARRGIVVDVLERGTRLGMFACSVQAGGMIAPWCELEIAGENIARLGEISLPWWRENFPGLVQKGSLVVAPARDEKELARFALRTRNFTWIARSDIESLEPDLSPHFSKALYFANEAHLDPRAVLAALADKLKEMGVSLRFGINGQNVAVKEGWIVDCRGLAARDMLPELRGVRGETVTVKARDINFTRPVRFLHPRFPLYVVPRGDNTYMLGATVLESESRARIAVRSAVELLNAAYALHPAFAEAEIIEMGADLRPAFPDNEPRITQQGQRLFINGLYRHGFLTAPALAQKAADIITGRTGVSNADLSQREMA